MLLAHHIWERTARGGQADEATFSEGLTAAMAELGDEFVVAWTGLTAGGRKLLVALAGGQSPYARNAGSSRGGAVQYTLNQLTASGEIVRDDTSVNGWRIVDPLFGAWLQAGRAS